MKKYILFVALVMTSVLTAAEYRIDTSHSHVMFKVKHLAISTVTGRFETFSGTFTFDPADIAASKGAVTIDVSSINTDVPDRDKHLKSPDFFDVNQYPNMTFASTGVEKTGDTTFNLTGNLTLHGVTRPVTLHVTYNGMIKDPWGNTRVAFTAEGKLNRKDFGLTWNKVMETGGLVVGDEIRLIIEIEAIQKKKEKSD